MQSTDPIKTESSTTPQKDTGSTTSDRKPLSEVIDKEPTNKNEKILEQNRVETPSFHDDPDYHKVADLFDLDVTDRRDPKIAEKLSFIYNWAEKVSPEKDKMEIMRVMKMAPRGFMINATGPTLVKKLYFMTRLDSQRRRITKEMDLYR